VNFLVQKFGKVIKVMDNKIEETNYYIERVARAARKEIESIIKNSPYKLTPDNLKKIISFFGGTLENTKKILIEEIGVSANACIIKGEKNSFEIKYSDNLKNMNPLKILHELGHAFFDLDTMETGQILYSNGKQSNDVKADLFAREFLMPRKLFELAIVEHLNHDGCNIDEVANKYGVDSIDVFSIMWSST
jgi:Zn-dependent peptidase ImmA (M78 family)